jgi:hypothetical protein
MAGESDNAARHSAGARFILSLPAAP